MPQPGELFGSEHLPLMTGHKYLRGAALCLGVIPLLAATPPQDYRQAPAAIWPAPARAASGAHQVAVSFTQQPDGGAEVVLTADGRGRVPRVMRNITHETFDLGSDLFTPVTEDNVSPGFLPAGVLGEVFVTAEPLKN